MKHYLLLGTEGCHLCEEAEVILASVKNEHIRVSYIDIAEQTQWQEKYAVKIPVLYDIDLERELCWPFTLSDVYKFIST